MCSLFSLRFQRTWFCIVLSCYAQFHTRKEASDTFDARHSEAVRQNLGTCVRRFLIPPLSFPFGEWHPVRVFACWVFSGCVSK